MCHKTFPGKMQHIHPLITDREPRNHQSPTWWANGFYQSDLQRYGGGVTYRSRFKDELRHQRPPQYERQLTKVWKAGAHRTASRQINIFPNDSVGLNFFQATHLVSASSRKLVLFQSLYSFSSLGLLICTTPWIIFATQRSLI